MHLSFERRCISFQCSQKYVPNGPTRNTPLLVQVMTWRQKGDMPLPEPLMSQYTDAYIRLPARLYCKAATLFY